jgi:hypothetical protein
MGIILQKRKFIKVIHSLDIQRTLSLSAEADVEQIQMNLLVSRKWHTVPKTGTNCIDGYSVPFSVADCPAQFRNPDLKTTSDCVTTWKTSQRLFDEFVM